MTARRRVEEVALTVSACVGALCLAAAAACVAVGARPVVFQSGSMSPTIHTGALGLTRPVPVAELRVGDVVTVPAGSGQVTHRVVALERRGTGAVLTLRGDANPAPDAAAHRVGERVEVLVASVPHLGRAVAWLSGPVGLLLLGAYAAWLLSVLLRRPSGGSGRDPDHRRARGSRRAPVAGASGALLLLTAGPAGAAWVDDVHVGATTPAVLATVTPAAPTIDCAVLSLGSVRLDWPGVAHATGYRIHAGTSVVATVSGTATEHTLSGLLSGTSLSVTAVYGGADWVSPASNTKTYTEVLGVGACV